MKEYYNFYLLIEINQIQIKKKKKNWTWEYTWLDWNPRSRTFYLILDNLPKLPEFQFFHLWNEANHRTYPTELLWEN